METKVTELLLSVPAIDIQFDTRDDGIDDN